MMKKSFNKYDLRQIYLKKIITYTDFLDLKTNVIFKQDFNSLFNYSNTKVCVVFKTGKVIDNRVITYSYPFVYFYLDGRILFSIFSSDFKHMSYSEFIDLFLSKVSDNFIEQISMEDYLL